MNETNGDNRMPLVCPRCSQHWSLAPPPPEISNNLRSSSVTIAHEKLVKCPNRKCAQSFVIMIQGCQLVLQVQAVGDDVVEQVEGSKIVKPSSELIG